MALVLANNGAVLEAVISIPRVGAWHADLSVDQQDELTGSVTIAIGDGELVLRGTAARGGAFADAASLRVAGGAGGLGRTATPRHYTATNVRMVLQDLLAAAGEALAVTADAATLARSLSAWTTTARPVGSQIADLIASAAPGAAWRVLAGGTVWVGPEAWPDSGLTEDDYQVLEDDPAQASQLLGVEVPRLLPGTLLSGRRVSRVEHRITAGAVRTAVWFETEGAAGDRLADDLRALILGAGAARADGPVDYRAFYLARVVAQAGATVDVQPDDPRLPTMAGVKLMAGAAGERLSGSRGGRVLVGWSGGDPKAPFAMGFDGDTRGGKLVINADQIILGGEAGAEFAVKGQTLQAFLTALVSSLISHVHAGVTTGGGVSAVSPQLAQVVAPTVTTTITKVR